MNSLRGLRIAGILMDGEVDEDDCGVLKASNRGGVAECE